MAFTAVTMPELCWMDCRMGAVQVALAAKAFGTKTAPADNPHVMATIASDARFMDVLILSYPGEVEANGPCGNLAKLIFAGWRIIYQ